MLTGWLYWLIVAAGLVMMANLADWFCWLIGWLPNVDVWQFWLAGWLAGYIGWVAGCLPCLAGYIGLLCWLTLLAALLSWISG
jgi:hypothetical protein